MQIRHNNIWGSICENGFNLTDADVVCRQLGFLYANDFGTFGGYSDGPIWLDNINCLGNESFITECDHSGWGVSNCYHSEDVVVNCFDGKITRIHILHI